MLKKSMVASLLVAFCTFGYSQTPVKLSLQSNFTYTETFSDIDNWVFNSTPANGTFTAGVGAAAWSGNIVGGITTVPSPSKITVNTSFFQTPPTGFNGYSSGVYRGSQNLVLLSTGTSNNTSSAAMDFYMNFTGVNAGLLSFDWASINNSTGNRSSSLKIYATVDGINFTEVPGTEVLNFTNNVVTAGNITNVPLPAIFNNSATARLRFYYYNGTGGITGSRPRLGIDNIKITAVPTAICAAPTDQPSNFTNGTVINNAISFSFTAASSAPHHYLVVMSNNNALSSNPIDFTTYNQGENLGDGTVIAITNNTSITATGLTAATTYYFYIFAVNDVCSGGPLYNTANPLNGNATTLAGALPCMAPPLQPTSLLFSNISTNSITGSFTAAANTNEYLVIKSSASSFSGALNNGTIYQAEDIIGDGTVVVRTAGTGFTASNLSDGTSYYFYIIGLNNQNCTGGPVYSTVPALKSLITTNTLAICSTPLVQPTVLNIVASNTSVNGYFLASASADGYLVVRSASATLSASPVNTTIYAAGDVLGNGIVVQSKAATSFIDTGLTATSTYYYFVFAKNSNCSSGPLYLTTNPLIETATTTAVATLNYYYGNLHAHSSYSDGNKDNGTMVPTDDYAYAKNSLCMDFLGISEHNHATAGMHIIDWQPGLSQAAAATNASFLAMYGMEWGIISNGGHVLVYGSNQLIGWETNNYNVYVPKSDYTGTPQTTGTTGLFRTLNNMGGNVFATFAHPGYSDFNDLANLPLNATADSAVVGSAVASGNAFSTNNTYSDAPAAFGYLDYYTRMLAKGYHIGPLMDQDTHNTNFGRSSNNRLVVMAPSLSSNDFYTAMRNMNFYASEDCDTRVALTINNQPMGSALFGTSAPAITVSAIDPTNPTSLPAIHIMYGIAGSNIAPIQIFSTTAKTVSFTDFLLPAGVNAYYYADITIAGNRTVTAPIWYTIISIVPLQLQAFTAKVNNNKQVELHWNTSNEINCRMFIAEKSFDGNRFTTVDTIAANNNNHLNNYQLIDRVYLEKITYYRIKQIDNNGKFTYSDIKAVNPAILQLNTVNIYPNPVKDIANLSINSTANCMGTLHIADITGRLIFQQTIAITKGHQQTPVDLGKLSSGNYLLTLHWNNQISTLKLVK
jgi:hypothetical protein